MSETNTVINALMRLERAGSESSKTTEKLLSAARLVSEKICQSYKLPLEASETGGFGVELPRGYILFSFSDADPNERRAICTGGVDFPDPVFDDRDSALRFAQDIATGWLDDLAAFIESQTTSDTDAADVLIAAASELSK